MKSDWGHCRGELLDEAGRALPGHTRDDADDIVADAVDTAISWQARENIGELARRPVRLCLYLQNARLYSFRISSQGTQTTNAVAFYPSPRPARKFAIASPVSK